MLCLQFISKWIWKSDFVGKDIYCDFADSFDYNGGKVSVKISADSNYALYINGNFVESGQYGDYPHPNLPQPLKLNR